MKNILLFALEVALVVHCFAQNATEANDYWLKNVVPKIMGKDYFSYKCRITSQKTNSTDTIHNPEYIVQITPNGRFTYYDNYWLSKTNGNLYIVDFDAKVFSYGTFGPDKFGFDVAFDKESAAYFSTQTYIPFYYDTKDSSAFNMEFILIKDTLCEGKKYKVLRSAMQKWSTFDSAGNRLPVFDTIDYYVNSQSFMVEKMVIHKYWDVNRCKNCIYYNVETCEYGDFSFSESQFEEYEDNLFNADVALKHGFSVYNFNKEMPPSFGNDLSKGDFDYEALDTPLIDIDSNTTSLRITSGWKLLYFWIYACRPCLKTYEQFSVEKETTGFRFLEKKGIRLFALYSGGSVTEKFKDYTKKYGFSDIAYSALGIANHIRINSYPYYILLSPSNDVVYKTSSLGDYSELFKAKQEYEQKHQSK